MRKKDRRAIIFFSITFSVIIGIFLINLAIQYGSHKVDQEPPAKVTRNVLPIKEYERVRDELLLVVDDEDAGKALDTLRELSRMDATVGNSCHPLAHDIGRDAFRRYGDFGKAMKYFNGLCGNAYVHGVIEGLVRQLHSSKEVVTALKEVCTSYPITKLIGLECYHGLGHGIMNYTLNDISQSLIFCDSLGEKTNRACYGGLFMEMFNTNELFHPISSLDPRDPFSVCRNQKTPAKPDCYHYAIHYFLQTHENDAGLALKQCDFVEKQFREDCASGVGDLVIQRNLDQTKAVEKLCMSATSEGMRNACLSSVAWFYMNRSESITRAEFFCNEFEAVNKAVCFRVFKNYTSLL